MTDDLPFEVPEVVDADILWAAGLLGLQADAFHGKDGTDPRQEVLKCMDSLDIPACPGSGKTTLLVAKLAILAEKWRYRTRGICVLSHTNAARNEIETKLGCTAVGRRLLSYPHFIGTIHGFVNEFLAIPWLRSRGHQVKMIDTEICLKRRWAALLYGTRLGLEKNGHSSRILSITSPDFGIGDVPWGRNRVPLREDSDTYKDIRSVCQQSCSEGYHCYDEMFVWARDIMDQHPSVVEMIRHRFPLLFIDEAQDNSEDQSAILHGILGVGGGSVIRQRFGDDNQAIYGSTADNDAITDPFPSPHVETMPVPNSHRFGQDIADLADPLGLLPCGLVGQGPKEPLDSGLANACHTIFLFGDGQATRVMDAYAELLTGTFSEAELRDGVFCAVSHIHNPSDTADRKKYPRDIPHYWPEYDPVMAKPDPHPETLVEYIFAGQARSETNGATFAAVEKIAEGILRLVDMIAVRPLRTRPRRSHRYVLKLLDEHTDVQQNYQSFLVEFAVDNATLTEETWNEVWKDTLLSVAKTIAGTSHTSADMGVFLAWRERPSGPVALLCSAAKRDNIYRCTKNGKEVAIRVGSIHSVKGETHTATLVLESFWNDHNLAKLRPWIIGPRTGWDKKDKKEQRKRLKAHYVAMTRPTHLLCLAMKRSTFEDANGDLDPNLVQKVKQRGWDVKCI